MNGICKYITETRQYFFVTEESGIQNLLREGKSVVGNLADDLQKEFPGIGGFSVSNLWRMRLFYEAYADNENLAPMVREISWTKN